LDALIRVTRQLVLFCLLLGAAAPASARNPQTEPSAADVATARDLFRDGVRLAAEEKWEAALDAYQRSMSLRPSNLTRYSIAIIQEKMGRLVEATENLRVFLAEDHDSSTRRYLPNARDMVHQLERRIARIKVIIPGKPRGAQLFIDGEPIPDAAVGVHRPVDPGEHRVEVRVPGHPTFVKMVKLEEAAELDVLVQLDRGEKPVAEQPQPETSGTGVEPVQDNTTALVLTIGGAGVFTTGLGLGIYGYAKAKGADTSEGSDADSARTMALIGDIGMGVGLVAAGVGTYMLLSDDQNEPTPSAGLVVSPWAGHGSAGFAATGRF
jgi:PEGA domain